MSWERNDGERTAKCHDHDVWWDIEARGNGELVLECATDRAGTRKVIVPWDMLCELMSIARGKR